MMQKLKTWTWVLSANFAEGVPYTIVNVMLVALLADMGAGNGKAAMIPSLLALPWMWKFLWSPVVDTRGTKRNWMLAMQAVMGVAFTLIAFSLQLSWWLPLVVCLSSLAALASATYDVACDGFYMLSLTPQQQAFFVGIRSTAYRLGMLFVSGFLLILAKDGSIGAWSRTFFISGLLMLALAVVHKFLLPKPLQEIFRKTDTGSIRSFFSIHHGRELVIMLLFIFSYRLGEAFLSKVTMLFLKDSVVNGGMGLDNEQYGFIYGTFGTLSLVIGGILGGICISRWGLRRCIIPMALALNIPDLLYVWMAQMEAGTVTELWLIGTCVSIEQFGYGFGFTAFTVYLLECAKGPYQTSHYAFLTALMAFGLMIPSTISGYVQEAMQSYHTYFIMACMLTVPGLIMTWVVFKSLKTEK